MENLSALIFVALAVAWAAYLIPKALRHHAEADETRSVETFSSRLRVLARREPVSRKATRLVVNTPSNSDKGPSVTEIRGRRLAAKRATERRRRVLSLILVACVVVGGLAGYGTIVAAYAAIPGGLLVAWLVACRLMVKRERDEWVSLVRPSSSSAGSHSPSVEPVESVETKAEADTENIPRVGADTTPSADPKLWDPVPVTLPTYVTKPAAARRTVRSIDLESSGVWTSGRSEVASRIAREAEEIEATAKAVETDEAEFSDQAHAVGS